jgi:hypothetical protein
MSLPPALAHGKLIIQAALLLVYSLAPALVLPANTRAAGEPSLTAQPTVLQAIPDEGNPDFNSTPALTATPANTAAPTLAITATPAITITPGITATLPLTGTTPISNTNPLTGSNPITSTLPITGPPPLAGPDYYQVAQGSSLEVPAPGLLSNDSTGGEVSLQISIGSEPENGQLELKEAGSFVYTPEPDFAGFDTFTYFVQDGLGQASPGLVTIEVLDVEKPALDWIVPGPDGEILALNQEAVDLEVSAGDNQGVQQVWFYRWDPLQEVYLEIGSVYTAPYRIQLETSQLSAEWNQIFARAFDASGNPSERGFIWLVQPTVAQDLEPEQSLQYFFLPGLFR